MRLDRRGAGIDGTGTGWFWTMAIFPSRGRRAP